MFENSEPLEYEYDRSTLPAFASDYNKKLDAEIKEKEDELDRMEKELEANQTKIELMKEHLKNVNSEFLNTQSLLNARNKEVSSEEHIRQLADRESGKIKVESEKLAREKQELQEKANSIQNATFKTRQRLEQYEKELKMGKEQLEQWALARKQKEDDNLALAKFARADEKIVKDLTLQIEKLTKEVKDKQLELDKEVTETRAAQIELDKTGIEFKTLHHERQELLQQWAELVNTMERRDQAISAVGANLGKAKIEIQEKQKVIAEKLKFLQSEQENNKELEQKIAGSDRQLTKLRSEYTIAQHDVEEYQDELETIKNTLSKTAASLEEQKAEIIAYKKEIQLKLKRVQRLKSTHASTKHDLENHYQQTDDLDARAKQLDTYYKHESQRLDRVEKEHTELKQQLFKESQELFKLRQEEQNLLSELNGSKASEKNLLAKIHRLDAESLKQQELVYNQEYQLQQLERKISRAQGERTNEEKQILTAKIKELTTQLDVQNEQYNLLSSQQKKIEEDVRAAKRKLENYQTEKQQLMTKINEMHLDNDSSQRSLKAIIKKKEELLVEENFVRLDVKRLRDLLYLRADEVYGLENRKFQLKLSMEERKQEIAVHEVVLKAQLRTVEEERHENAKELAARLTKIEKLKRKYQLLMLQLSPDGEEEKSQAYYIIKAAQQKEEYQKQKDDLEAQISKAKAEIFGLENSLASFNALNQRLHVQKTRGGMTAEDMHESEMLAEKLGTSHQMHKQKQEELKVLEQELEQLEENRNNLSRSSEEAFQELDNLDSLKAMVLKDIDEQTHKIQRAQNQLDRLAKACRKKKKQNDGEETVIDKEVKLFQLKEMNTTMLNRLRKFTQTYPQLADQVSILLQEAGMQFPSRPTSQSGSYAGSIPVTPSPRQSNPSTPPGKPSQVLSPKTLALALDSSQDNNRKPQPISRNQSRTPSRTSTRPSSRPGSTANSPRQERPDSAHRLPVITSRTTSPVTTPPLTPTRFPVAVGTSPSRSNSRSSVSRVSLEFKP